MFNSKEDVRKIQAEMTRMNTESAELYEALRDEEPNESLTSLEDNKKVGFLSLVHPLIHEILA